jgi:hypothetical protein
MVIGTELSLTNALISVLDERAFMQDALWIHLPSLPL